ncbi:MAG TPA: hypothetical protein VF251_07460 [Pyrinomonadaceae bacterium]
MQSVAVLNGRMNDDYAERSEALSQAAQRLVNRLLGCWQHDLSRPFTRNGKSYRVCMKCGIHRSFNLETWRTERATSALPATSLSEN